MTTRLRLFSLALALFGALLLPACSGFNGPAPTAPPPPQAQTAEVAPAPVDSTEAASSKTTESELALDAALPVDPAIRTGELENGFRYWVRANSRPSERAELRLLVNAGSLQEDDDQQGLAHFVEHMAFNGTERFESQELVEYLESIGMRFGPDINAYTNFDETVYMLTVPTDDSEIVDTAFEILADWARGIAFDPEEVDKERGVVIEEWRLGRGADARLRDKQFPVLFQGSRYAERLPIGEVEILETAPPERLRSFYHDWYRPDLMAFVAVGDFDPERFEERVRETFGGLEGPEEPRPRETAEVPGHEETLFSVDTDPELTSTTVFVYTKLPRPPEGTVGDYRRSLVEGLYHGMLNARLREVSRLPDPPFLAAFSSAGSLVRARHVARLAAAVQPAQVQRGLEALLVEAARADRHGFTASELERAKTDTLRGYQQAFEERDKLPSAGFASEYSRAFLEGESTPGIAFEKRLAETFLPGVSLEEVNRLAGSWITEENRVVLVSAPEETAESLPGEDEITAIFHAAEEKPVEPWVDRTRDEPLLAEKPEPGPVVETAEHPEVGATVWKLANGARVVLKPTDFKNDEILLSGFSPGGSSLVSDEDHTSAVFSTAITGQSGLGLFDQIELGKALAGKVAGAAVSLSELEEGVSGAASPKDLETLFQLVYLRFTAPRFDEEAYASYMTKMRSFVENRLKNPQAVFGDRFNEVLYQGHPRRRPMTPELLDEIDPERALEIYRERFADAGDFTFLLVGNFELEGIRPLVETYLGGLPSAGREETWRDVGIERPVGKNTVEVEKGLEPQSQVILSFGGEAEWSRERSIELEAVVSVLETRLRELLREEKGATYGVSVWGSLNARPAPHYQLSLGFGCAPEKVEELTEAAFAEIEAMRAGEIEETHVANFREAQLRERQTDLEENSFWLGALEYCLTYGIPPEDILLFDGLVQGIGVETVRDAARRYLDSGNYVLGVLEPEAEATAAEGEAGDDPEARAGGSEG